MKVIECYELREWNQDGLCYNHIAYVKEEASAKQWKGSDQFKFYEPATVVIFDNLPEMLENESTIVRERALAKLTVIERKALGY